MIKRDALKNIYFRADAPQIYDVDEEKGWSGAFAGDTLNAYYPENNSTWNRKTFKDYGGKITWKPYVKGKPLDDAKERTVTIEGGGRASVRFYLCDENGDALPENVFKFYGHSTIVSKKDEEKNNETATSKSQIDDSIRSFRFYGIFAVRNGRARSVGSNNVNVYAYFVFAVVRHRVLR